jgi:hypothetical protein
MMALKLFFCLQFFNPKNDILYSDEGLSQEVILKLIETYSFSATEKRYTSHSKKKLPINLLCVDNLQLMKSGNTETSLNKFYK